MEIIEYINENSLVLIPALYILGVFVKNAPRIPDWTIPFILLFVGVISSVLINGMGVDSVIQGVLVTGAAVLSNQAVKQIAKGSKERKEANNE